MKKFLTLTLLGLSAVANAETAVQAQADEAKPILALAVYDISNAKEPKMLERNLSRSNKNQHLCWTATNVGAVENGLNMVIEQFISPTSITITDANGTTAQRSKDGKKHVLLSYAGTLEGNFVEKCWQFSNKYPIGEYKLIVRVNESEFPAQSFKIVK